MKGVKGFLPVGAQLDQVTNPGPLGQGSREAHNTPIWGPNHIQMDSYWILGLGLLKAKESQLIGSLQGYFCSV